MSHATDHLLSALDHAMAIRPRVGGFPVIAEVLRNAGVSRNEWFLPAATSLYETTPGSAEIRPIVCHCPGHASFGEHRTRMAHRAGQTRIRRSAQSHAHREACDRPPWHEIVGSSADPGA